MVKKDNKRFLPAALKIYKLDMKTIDSILNNITTYRLTLYYLIFLVGVAAGLSFLGILNYNPLDILINALLAIIACYGANYVLAKMFRAVTNVESVFYYRFDFGFNRSRTIPLNVGFIIGASVLAMAAKYLLSVEKRHIFNPAAVSVAAIALISPEHTATGGSARRQCCHLF